MSFIQLTSQHFERQDQLEIRPAVFITCPECGENIFVDLKQQVSFETYYNDFTGMAQLGLDVRLSPAFIDGVFHNHYRNHHEHLTPPKVVRWDRYGDPVE